MKQFEYGHDESVEVVMRMIGRRKRNWLEWVRPVDWLPVMATVLGVLVGGVLYVILGDRGLRIAATATIALMLLGMFVYGCVRARRMFSHERMSAENMIQLDLIVDLMKARLTDAEEACLAQLCRAVRDGNTGEARRWLDDVKRAPRLKGLLIISEIEAAGWCD